MVTDEPLPVLTLARAVGRPTGDVSAALATLAAEYTEQGRGFDLREVGGGWRYYTRVEAAPYVERFVLDGQQARLTQKRPSKPSPWSRTSNRSAAPASPPSAA